MLEFQHKRDRKRFERNMELAENAEMVMREQRKALGLPEFPKGDSGKRATILNFRPHQPRD